MSAEFNLVCLENGLRARQPHPECRLMNACTGSSGYAIAARRSDNRKNGPAGRGQNKAKNLALAVKPCPYQALCTCTGLEKMSRP